MRADAAAASPIIIAIAIVVVFFLASSRPVRPHRGLRWRKSKTITGLKKKLVVEFPSMAEPMAEPKPGKSPEEMTGLLKAWAGGDRAALDRLTPLVLQELKRIARRQMRAEHGARSLQTTALV